MSLATLHTKATRSVATARQMPARIAARLCRIDVALALDMQAWVARGEPEAPIPEAFVLGNAAPCFALVRIAAGKPALFWGALVAIPAIPVLLALHWI